MKKLLLFIFFPIAALCQEPLTINNGEITWQKIYETDLSKEELKNSIKSNATLNPIAENFSGTANAVSLDCQKTIPIYLEGKIQFFALIEYKEGRYRVSVSNINVIPNQTMELWGVRETEAGKPLEDYQVRNNGEFRKNNMATNTRECIENYFVDLFYFTKVSNDW